MPECIGITGIFFHRDLEKEITMAKYSKKAQDKVERAMHERKHGTLKSGRGGKGGKVKSRKQAIAIGLSEARKAGAKVPKKKSTSGRKSTGTKKKSSGVKKKSSGTKKKTGRKK